MKTLFLTFCMICSFLVVSAHAIWIETAPKGKLNKQQEVRIYYGEYAENQIEKVDGRFKEADAFTAWVITPDGKKDQLRVIPDQNCYVANFTPAKDGNYAIVVVNTNRPVVDWSKYNLGILKPNYYALASVSVNTKDTFNRGDKATELNIVAPAKLYKRKAHVPFSVFYRGVPATNQKVIVMAPNGWTKELTVNDEGKAEFVPLWKGIYVAEVVYTEHEKGDFQGAEFESIRERCTYTFLVK